MKLVTLEPPASGMAFRGELPEFLDASLRIVVASRFEQVVADQLIEGLAQTLRSFADTLH